MPRIASDAPRRVRVARARPRHRQQPLEIPEPAAARLGAGGGLRRSRREPRRPLAACLQGRRFCGDSAPSAECATQPSKDPRRLRRSRRLKGWRRRSDEAERASGSPEPPRAGAADAGRGGGGDARGARWLSPGRAAHTARTGSGFLLFRAASAFALSRPGDAHGKVIVRISPIPHREAGVPCRRHRHAAAGRPARCRATAPRHARRHAHQKRPPRPHSRSRPGQRAGKEAEDRTSSAVAGRHRREMRRRRRRRPAATACV